MFQCGSPVIFVSLLSSGTPSRIRSRMIRKYVAIFHQAWGWVCAGTFQCSPFSAHTRRNTGNFCVPDCLSLGPVDSVASAPIRPLSEPHCQPYRLLINCRLKLHVIDWVRKLLHVLSKIWHSKYAEFPGNLQKKFCEGHESGSQTSWHAFWSTWLLNSLALKNCTIRNLCQVKSCFWFI